MIVAFFLLGIILFLTLAVIGYRYRAHQAEVRANRAEGALDEARSSREHFRDLAEKAWRLAAEAVRLDPDKILRQQTLRDVDPQMDEKYRQINSEIAVNSASNYTAQVVANCPSCNVSVRHPPEDYPVKCPACKTLIDPTFDNPPTFS